MSQWFSSGAKTQLLEFVSELSKQAKELAKNNYAIDRKLADHSPVTELDRFLNSQIVGYLQKHFPGHGIVAEESLELAPKNSSGPRWFVDPLDGTEQFIRGLDEWAIQIGLVWEGRSVFGVVAPPLREQMYFGEEGQGSFVTEKGVTRKLQVATVALYSDLRIIESRFHSSKKVKWLAEMLAVKDFKQMGGLGMKLSEIATARADVYFHLSAKCSLWDICAPEVILNEAGGQVLTLSGNPIDYYQPEPFKVGDGFIAIAEAKFASELRARVVREMNEWQRTKS